VITSRYDADVLIIGAGAAGLAAARDLALAGRSVIVIEARDRIGGRIHTMRLWNGLPPVELGAEFVHGRPPETFTLAYQAGLTLIEASGVARQSRSGKLRQPRGTGMARGWTIIEALRAYTGPDMPFTQFAAAQFAGPEWAEAREAAARYLAGFDAADPDAVSIHWKARNEAAAEQIDGDRMFRVLDGYDRVPHWLLASAPAERVALHLNTVAHDIQWAHGQVTVTAHHRLAGDARSFTARAAIITVPLGVLAAPPDLPGALRFTPDLPVLAEARAGLAMGHVVKVIFRCRTVFWDAPPPAHPTLPGLGFLLSDDATMPTWWTMQPLHVPILTGWVGGPRAARLAQDDPDAIIDHAIAALARALGQPRHTVASQIDAWRMHNWSADPFTRGAYSYVRAGGLPALERLAAPIADTIVFAGEATDADHTGTVHGALASGHRAAAALPGLTC
jgi:monoamine oxidase